MLLAIICLGGLTTHSAAQQIPVDADWLAAYKHGSLLWSPNLTADVLVPELGNGYFALHPATNTAAYLAGVFNGDDGDSPIRASVPPFRVTVDFESNHGCALDLQRAVFECRGSLPTDNRTLVQQTWYAHRTLRNVFVHQVAVTASPEAAVTVNVILAPSTASNEIAFARVPTHVGLWCINGSILQQQRPGVPPAVVAHCATVPLFNLTASAGSTVIFYFVSTFASSLDSVDPLNQAQQTLLIAAKAPSTLLPLHVAAWAALWDGGRIEVAGNLALAQAVNASLYFIMSSVRADWPLGLSPGGLSSSGYEGHSFWDMDTWMVPALILLQPDLAQSCLKYRSDRQSGAAAKAAVYNYSGLMFPWESAYTGYEVQTSHNVPGPWGQFEQHITGDVAFAHWQFWVAGQESRMSWLNDTGLAVLQGCADFWASRVETVPNDGLYHINNIMPPDENHFPVNDSVYTNTLAQLTLQHAAEALASLGRPAPANWSDIQNRMAIPWDAGSQYHPEFSGYTRGTVVKQADVVMLGFPFPFPNSTVASRQNDLLYYANYTDPNGPAMTWAMFAIGWLEIGNFAQANAFFARGYANVQDPFKVWTETPRGGTINFITGAGGFLQSVLFGFGGLRLYSDSLRIAPPPNPPQNATALVLHGVSYAGASLRLDIVAAAITVTLLAAGPSPLYFHQGTAPVRLLATATPVVATLAPAAVSVSPTKA